MTVSPPSIVLVAPNLSRTMGGEALKALQIHQELRALGVRVYQVAHARVAREMARDFPDLDIAYVPDGPMQIALNRMKQQGLLSLLNSWQLTRLARRVARDQGADLVHFTSPISPVLPYFAVPGRSVVIGPINGAIYHPPAFADRETKGKWIGQQIQRPMQAVLGALFPARRAAMLLVAGGERTAKALEMAGCSRTRMVKTLDSGIPGTIEARPRLTHQGLNHRFVFAGRLVRYKGCDLAIRAIAKSASGAMLDVIGDGEERQSLEQLVDALGVRDRVRFLGWVGAGEPMFEALRAYRAFVMPTLAEANGIGVQEAMMLGLPVLAVNWGGPAELLTAETGILIEPDSEAGVVDRLSTEIDRLADDPAAADALSAAARDDAVRRGFTWPHILRRWFAVYDAALVERGKSPRFEALSAE